MREKPKSHLCGMRYSVPSFGFDPRSIRVDPRRNSRFTIYRRIRAEATALDLCGYLPYSVNMATATRPTRQLRKQHRLEARLTRDQKRLIERAAELRGSTVTDFVIVTLQKAATETIKDFETLVLRDRAREVFVNAIVNPPAPNQAARAAARRYKEQIGI